MLTEFELKGKPYVEFGPYTDKKGVSCASYEALLRQNSLFQTILAVMCICMYVCPLILSVKLKLKNG